MSEFKKSVKGSEHINARAAEREMPDARILDEVRESGVNQAMKDFVPPRGTTVVRTKKEAKKVIKILKEYKDRIHGNF